MEQRRKEAFEAFEAVMRIAYGIELLEAGTARMSTVEPSPTRACARYCALIGMRVIAEALAQTETEAFCETEANQIVAYIMTLFPRSYREYLAAKTAMSEDPFDMRYAILLGIRARFRFLAANRTIATSH